MAYLSLLVFFTILLFVYSWFYSGDKVCRPIQYNNKIVINNLILEPINKVLSFVDITINKGENIYM